MMLTGFLIILLQSVPVLFSEGSLSTEQVDYGIAFSPDEREAYVVRHAGAWGKRDNPPSKIHRYEKNDGRWIYAGYVAFSDSSSVYFDSDIFISHDGKEMYFISNRPYQEKPGNGDPDIWRIQLNETEGVWGNPEPLHNVNSAEYEASPVTDAQGNLYFSSIRDEGPGLGDFYKTELLDNGNYDQPQLLEGPVNSGYGEWNLLVSPEADWIIFESSGRPEGLSSYGDLYISYKEKGSWSEPEHLAILNSRGSDLNARILPESGQLIYASTREKENTDSDFYVISLEELKLTTFIPKK